MTSSSLISVADHSLADQAGPGWEQQQASEQRRWQEEREAHGLAIRVSRQLLNAADATWLTPAESRVYRIAATIVLQEAEQLSS